MKKKTIYCECCNDECSYRVSLEKREVTIRGLTFSVEIKVATCSKCHERVFPYEISRENDLIIYDKYKELKGLLTSKQIKEIREKRGMSQTELARFINCGEKNIARYEKGAIQDNSFDLLIRLVGDDKAYKEMKKVKNNSNAKTALAI